MATFFGATYLRFEFLDGFGGLLPSGELTQQWKITIFNGKINYKWPFSIAMLVHQRVPASLATALNFAWQFDQASLETSKADWRFGGISKKNPGVNGHGNGESTIYRILQMFQASFPVFPFKPPFIGNFSIATFGYWGSVFPCFFARSDCYKTAINSHEFHHPKRPLG